MRLFYFYFSYLYFPFNFIITAVGHVTTSFAVVFGQRLIKCTNAYPARNRLIWWRRHKYMRIYWALKKAIAMRLTATAMATSANNNNNNNSYNNNCNECHKTITTNRHHINKAANIVCCIAD